MARTGFANRTRLRRGLALPTVGTSAIISVGMLSALTACTPTPPAGSPTTSCSFAGPQTTVDLRANCTISGQLPNSIINPINSGDASCNVGSFLLFNQSLSTPATLIYGENGDENPGRVRIGILLPGGTHRGSIAKANLDCTGTVGPIASINTTFSGRHRAILDKEETPICVFQSRLDLTDYTQTLSAGLPVDVSGATRGAVQATLERRLDLQAATTIGAMFQPSADRSEARFVSRSGRCRGRYTRFAGT